MWKRKGYLHLRIDTISPAMTANAIVTTAVVSSSVSLTLCYYLCYSQYFPLLDRCCLCVTFCVDKLHELEVDQLYPLAIEARYPDTGIEVTIDEAREAIEKAKKAIAFITRKIKHERN